MSLAPRSVSPAPAPGCRAARGIDLAALAALLALHGVLVRRFAFRVDDAFISFRYARHWAEGEGLRYHAGAEPPVEGFSNFLWVALLALARRLGFDDLPATADFLSVAASLILVAAVYVALRVRLAVERLPAWLGSATLAAAAPAFVWATGGLETAAFALTFALSAFLALEVAAGGSPRLGFCGGLASLALALLRVEGLLWVGALGVLALLAAGGSRRLDARSAAAWLAPVVIGYAALLVFRRATFEAWLPNTVVAKAGLSTAALARGLEQTTSFALTFPLALALAFAGGATWWRGTTRRHAWARMAFGSGAALLAYHVLCGGDWMPFFRFLVPCWPFAAVLAALFFARLPRLVAIPLGAGATLLAAAPAFGWVPSPQAWRTAVYFRAFEAGYETEAARWRKAVDNGELFTAIGRALGAVAAPGDSIALGAIGAIGYYSGLRVHDRNGLVDREVASRELEASALGTAGHDKRVPWSFFAERAPTFYEVTLFDPSQTPFPTAARAFASRIFARDPELARHCVAEMRMVPAGVLAEAPRAVLALRHEPDPGVAEAFWSR